MKGAISWLGCRVAGPWLVVASLTGCGATTREGDATDVSAGAANQPGAKPPRSSEPPSHESAHDACVPLASVAPQADADDLKLEYACGYRSAEVERYSSFLAGGTRCEQGEINTFALRLEGRAAADYSAVARCGYLHYDNGLFVGERVQVEARDGAWCHELALAQTDLADRILLTDVSFTLEARDATVPRRDVGVRFLTNAGWTERVSTRDSVCAYVAHREPGVSACGLASPASYCVCPCGVAWHDFFLGVELMLARR